MSMYIYICMSMYIYMYVDEYIYARIVECMLECMYKNAH